MTAPNVLWCGREFLLQIARRLGVTGTDEEILKKFEHCLNEHGFYVLRSDQS